MISGTQLSTRILWLPGAEERGMWDTEPSPRNPSGVRIDPDTALRSTVVLACARVLAESIGGLPLHLYKRDPSGGKSIAREHPLYNVLHSTPNSWQTSFEWREQAMLHLCLHGNAYNELRAGVAGAVSELIPLHPSRMKVERIENGRLRYVYTEPSGEKTIYTQDQIMHLRWLSNDGVTGMVPVELARDAIGLARACEIHGASYFGNGARPGIVLETDNMIPQEAATALRDNWERTHRGADRASKTAVLMGGLKAHELGGNNQESQFLESRRFQVEEICRLYRVPPHLVGDLTRSSFSNIEQQSIDFVQHTLLPWLRRFETAFARDLIVDNVTYFAEFDTRGLLRGDASARASYYQTLWNLGVASVNEIRGWENLNPVEAGDTRFVQLNMQTLEQASKPPAPPAAAPGLPGAAPSPAPPATQPPTGAAPQGPKLAQPAGRALWQEFSEELVSDGHEARSLTISVDFDQTFSADPELWGSFALDAVEAGNTVVMITRREDTPENQSVIKETLGDYAGAFSTVLLIGPETLKDDAAQKAGISVDVWIDDSPQTVMSRGFCPTGKGGGTDNSCSSKDGGGGGGDSIPDASALSRVKNLGGSTGAVLMKNEAGDQFVVKSGNSAGHVRSEAATNDIYAAIGVAVPKHKLDESDKSSPKQISEYLDGAKPLGSLKGTAREKAIASLRENFAADALVANWDVVGLNEDNVLVKDGEAYRVDNGGSLTYRAQGAQKTFGPTVGEIDSLRSSDQGRPIFGSLKNEEVASQIKKLASKRQKILRATPQPLRGVMAQRLDYMENWAKTAGSTPSERGFCPTGKEGGIDNSCGKEGGGGSDGGGGVGKGDYGGDFKASVGDRGFDVDEQGMMEFADRQDILATKEQADAILKYQAEGVYEELNGNLRMQGIDKAFTDFTDEQVDIIEKMDAAFETNSLSESCTLFRGINDDEGMVSSLKEGDTFSDSAYQSTTLNPIVAVAFAEGGPLAGVGEPTVLRISAKAGQPAIAADAIARKYGKGAKPSEEAASTQGFSIENEIVLPRGTGYRVRRVSVEDGTRFVDVEVTNAG